MKNFKISRRRFLKATGLTAGGFLLAPGDILARIAIPIQPTEPAVPSGESAPADYTLHIKASPVEIAAQGDYFNHHVRWTVPCRTAFD